MRQIVLITTMMAFIAGFFAAAQGLAAGEYEHGMASGGSSAMMEETQQQGMAVLMLDNDQVRELQQILKDNGFDAGTVDGILGPKTQQALRDFQMSEGLAVTGNPDTETLRALSPDVETQEFFGLSPEFGEKEMQQMQPMEEKGTTEGTKSMEHY